MAPIGQRAFTNPFSNSVVLSRFNLGEGVDTAASMQLPIRCLPQFLHETMHHWCFDSPVGLVLTLLQMRAKRHAALALLTNVTEKNQRQIAQDVARVNCFYEFTRPLIEALALYSEHNVTLGDSEIIGRPTFLAGLLFAGRQNDPNKIIEMLPYIIELGRLTPANVRRKANLLIQPILGTKEGYLAGYLSIHFLHFRAMQSSEKYIDTDFFLHVLRCWIFDDWDFVEFLLDLSLDYESWMEQMVILCQEKWVNFLSLDVATIAQFEARGLAAKPDVFQYSGSHLRLGFNSFPVVPVDKDHSGKSKLEMLLSDLFGSLPDDQTLKAIFRSDLDMLAMRSTITLGHGEFEASVTNNKMLQLRTELNSVFPVFSSRAPNELPGGWQQRVNVDLVLSTAPPGLTQLITDPLGYIAGYSFGASEEVPVNLRTIMANWEKREEKMALEDKFVKDVLDGSTEEFLLELTMLRTRRTRDAAFEMRGQPITPDAFLTKANAVMARDGFLPVLNNDLKLVEDAAAISLAVALHLALADAFPKWDWSHGGGVETAHYINSCFSNVLGYRPFIFSGEKLVFSMI